MLPNSKQLAGLIGPTIVVVTLSEFLQSAIWAANTPTVVYLNGTLLFIGGLYITRSHNHWSIDWSIVITLIGWFMILLGLVRMFAPELQLEAVRNKLLINVITFAVMSAGILLTFRSFAKNKDVA